MLGTLRESRDRFQMIVGWACCLLGHNTIVDAERIPASLYFLAGICCLVYGLNPRALNLNCFDLLYLFRGTGEFG